MADPHHWRDAPPEPRLQLLHPDGAGASALLLAHHCCIRRLPAAGDAQWMVGARIDPILDYVRHQGECDRDVDRSQSREADGVSHLAGVGGLGPGAAAHLPLHYIQQIPEYVGRDVEHHVLLLDRCNCIVGAGVPDIHVYSTAQVSTTSSGSSTDTGWLGYNLKPNVNIGICAMSSSRQLTTLWPSSSWSSC